MNNLYKYKTKCGLEVLYYHKKDFYKSYCGIGTKFGSANLKYELDGNRYEIKDGVAHFIEHKLFQMPNNIDAYQEFDKMNVEANAYTTHDKTVYFFNTVEDIYEPLALLLEMYFTPVFEENDINKEKDIIISEIQMTNDNMLFNKSYKIINHTYPNDDYSSLLTGTIESVKTITKEELDNIYKLFYTPNNSVLTIISSKEPEEVFEYIEKCLNKLKFNYSDVLKLPIISSKHTLKPQIIEENIYQDEAFIILRFDNLKSDENVKFELLMSIFENIFSISSKHINRLLKKHLFENDIDFECTSFKDSSYAVISAPSKKTIKFVQYIINLLNSLSIKDIDKELLEIRIKYMKSDYILSLDNISYLGDQILSLALEDLSYFEIVKNIDKINFNSLNEIINMINSCEKTYLIMKSKKVKN